MTGRVFSCAAKLFDDITTQPSNIIEIGDIVRFQKQVLTLILIANEEPIGCCQRVQRPTRCGLDTMLLVIFLAPTRQVDRLPASLAQVKQQLRQPIARRQLRNS